MLYKLLQLIKKALSLVPADYIATGFFLGSVIFARNVWVYALNFLLFGSYIFFSRLYRLDMLYWGNSLLYITIIILWLNVVFIYLYHLKDNFNPEFLIIDQFLGNIVLFTLTIPILNKIFYLIFVFNTGLCLSFLPCGIFKPVIDLVVFAFFLYYMNKLYLKIIEWNLFPIKNLPLYTGTTLACILDDIIAAVYASILMYITLFIPLQINIRDILLYFKHMIF